MGVLIFIFVQYLYQGEVSVCLVVPVKNDNVFYQKVELHRYQENEWVSVLKQVFLKKTLVHILSKRSYYPVNINLTFALPIHSK